MNTTMTSLLALAGRVLLALMFLDAGYGKIGGFAGTAGYIASKGLPMPQVLAAAALALELIGGLLLVIGWKARWAAAALAVFTLLAAVIFHGYWGMPAAEQMMQKLMFLKNLAVAGGLMMVVAFGAGRWSLDKR
ncbi:MAG TPA: DoxX family protein [Burkholderiaceae bacterium]|nr:DoxX family protein [Burkholderiaceae bacterium]